MKAVLRFTVCSFLGHIPSISWVKSGWGLGILPLRPVVVGLALTELGGGLGGGYEDEMGRGGLRLVSCHSSSYRSPPFLRIYSPLAERR